MLEINLKPIQTETVSVNGKQFKLSDPLISDVAAAEIAEDKVGGTIRLLKQMGVPDDLINSVSAKQAEELVPQLIAVFKEKK